MMDNNLYEAKLRQLIEQHRSGKSKMILGIVFIAISFFFYFLGYALSIALYVYWAIVAGSLIGLIFSGIGTPLLIIGIVRMSKTNRQISLLRAERTREQGAQATPPQPIPQQPAPQPQPEQAPPQEPANQQAAPQQQQSQQSSQGDAGSNPSALNWEQYSPLEAGISYDAAKDYQFHRADGFVGSVPQKFIDRTFIKCPICCSQNPNWTISQHNQMSWKGNLYLFKCSHCESIISMSMPDVTTLANGGGGVATNPTVGLTNLMVKASSGKEAGAVYAVIESVGNSGVTPACQGKEFKLEQLQQMSLRA